MKQAILFTLMASVLFAIDEAQMARLIEHYNSSPSGRVTLHGKLVGQELTSFARLDHYEDGYIYTNKLVVVPKGKPSQGHKTALEARLAKIRELREAARTNEVAVVVTRKLGSAPQPTELERMAKAALPAIIADTRENIPEVANLTDSEIAALYIAQMDKPATNTAETISHLIGRGMREDISK